MRTLYVSKIKPLALAELWYDNSKYSVREINDMAKILGHNSIAWLYLVVTKQGIPNKRELFYRADELIERNNVKIIPLFKERLYLSEFVD
jgi:hypothetical protein